MHSNTAILLVIFCHLAFCDDISQTVRNAFNAEVSRHSFLGNATDSITINETGYSRNYENGAVFMLDSTVEVHGLILDKYRRLVGPWGYLGFPLSDELTCTDGTGRYTRFQYGSVYYHPTHGTHQVMGALHSKWLASGAEAGVFGYPVADPVMCDTGMLQQFEHGMLGVRGAIVDLRKNMYRVGMRIRNQSWRGTCSVFAMACCIEYDYAQLLGGDYVDISEEYLNHVANLASGETDDGSCFQPVEKGFDAYGIVPEKLCPYDLSKNYDFASFTLPESTIATGKSLLTPKLKLKTVVIQPGCPGPSSLGLSSTRMDSVFMELRKGYPVAVGRGHSMTVVGYVNDMVFPGGGFFIIRNSYGPDADDNGFRYETIEHLKTTVYDAYAYEMPTGASFGRVVKGRVVNGNGAGIPNSRVEVSGITADYGAFMRYDSTTEDGSFRVEGLTDKATSVSLRATSILCIVERQLSLSGDTTDVNNLVVGSTHITRQNPGGVLQRVVVHGPASVGAILTFTIPTGSQTKLSIVTLSGQSVFRASLLPGTQKVTVPGNQLGHGVYICHLTSQSFASAVQFIR
jgi:hypothetical protein